MATNPQLLQQINFSCAPSRILTAGVQLGVFSQIAAGRTTAAEVAQAAGASQRGMPRLLNALVALELLTKSGDRYALVPLSEEYLVAGKPDYIGVLFENDVVWQTWGQLTESVRTGRPARRLEEGRTVEDYFKVLVRMLDVTNREPARRAAEVLGAGSARKGMQVVDIGCGSGVWGRAVAEADSQARITAQDFPGVLEVTRAYAQRYGVDRQFDFLPGDLNTVDLGDGRFDLAILGNILHGEGEASSRKLLARVHRALKPAGVVAIAETIPDGDRTGPLHPIMFSLHMLMSTEDGDTFTLAQLTRWLHDARFPQVETKDVGSRSPLVVGRKA